MTDVGASVVRVAAIARQNFREAVRDRVFYNLISFTALVVGAALVFSQISIAIERELLVNLGLTAISLTSVLLAVLLGVGLVAKEIERRTLYAVLARPVARWEFLSGKFCGLAATLTVNTACMAVALLLLVATQATHTPAANLSLWPVITATYFLLLQALILVAVALLFSSFSSPLLAAIFTLALFLIGSFTQDLHGMAQLANGASRWLLVGLVGVLPDLSSFNVIAAAAHGRAIPLRLIGLNTLYAALYGGAALGAAALIFSRREMK